MVVAGELPFGSQLIPVQMDEAMHVTIQDRVGFFKGTLHHIEHDIDFDEPAIEIRPRKDFYGEDLGEVRKYRVAEVVGEMATVRIFDRQA